MEATSLRYVLIGTLVGALATVSTCPSVIKDTAIERVLQTTFWGADGAGGEFDRFAVKKRTLQDCLDESPILRSSAHQRIAAHEEDIRRYHEAVNFDEEGKPRTLLDPFVLAAQIDKESRYNSHVCSLVGACGTFQVIPVTALENILTAVKFPGEFESDRRTARRVTTLHTGPLEEMRYFRNHARTLAAYETQEHAVYLDLDVLLPKIKLKSGEIFGVKKFYEETQERIAEYNQEGTTKERKGELRTEQTEANQHLLNLVDNFWEEEVNPHKVRKAEKHWDRYELNPDTIEETTISALEYLGLINIIRHNTLYLDDRKALEWYNPMPCPENFDTAGDWLEDACEGKNPKEYVGNQRYASAIISGGELSALEIESLYDTCGVSL